MLNITHYQRYANQNHNEVPSYANQNECHQKSTSNKGWRGCGEKGNLLQCWWECKLVQPLWKTVWRFIKKLEIELPYDPAIPLLGIHTKETRSERDRCTQMFITALFIIARTWKQPRCPSADEWIKNLWYIYTMEYYSTVKKNSFESVLTRWMKLEPIIQSEVSQKDKDHYRIVRHIYGIQKDGNDNPICKTEKETHMYRTDFWTLWEKVRVGCFAYRVIITIFLNSIHMCQYGVMFFIFLAYFTLYNGLQFHPSHQN